MKTCFHPMSRRLAPGIAALALSASAAMPAAAGAATPEDELLARLPSVFAKAADHYRALDAAATPLMKDAKGGMRTPHGFRREKGELDMRTVLWWTSGHFPGSLWFLYEATGDAFFRDRATAWTEIIEPAAKYDGNHDIGFMTYCSFGNARRVLGTDKYDGILLTAANTLSTRFHKGLGLIRSWGKKDDEKDFLVIPDNMMNLELLEWAGREKGEKRFAAIAESHADVTMRHHFREDGGSYHVLNYDQRPGLLGRVQEIRRGQGASCETAWSRGQSWGIYGYTMMYRRTGLARYLKFAKKLADYAVDHPNMPEDGIPYWDFGAPGEERDSSAGAVIASALVELSQYVGAADRSRYRAFAVKQLLALSSPAYFSEGDEIGHFLLKHGVGHKPGGSEIDTPLDYGDYYFLEALLRFRELKRREAVLPAVRAKLPAAPGLPGADRAGWAELAALPVAGKFVAAAEKMMSEPMPETTDELYLEFSRTGNRSHYQKPYFEKVRRLVAFSVAEALERKGRFVPKVVEYVDDLCAMKSWVLPAHDSTDGGNGTFRGTAEHVDLFSSEIASHLAYTVNFIGDSLPPETIAKIKGEAERRVFGPLRLTYSQTDDKGRITWRSDPLMHSWVCRENNWNSVCHDNVVTAAMALLDDPDDRAFFVACALRGLAHYARGGFAADGYCSEGMGYWNYGYGHLLMLGLVLRDLTGGGIDIFTEPIYRKAAEYAYSYQLEKGVSPAFADGNGAPSAANLALVRRVWPDLTGRLAEEASPLGTGGAVVVGIDDDHYAALLGFGKTPPPSGAADAPLPLRSEFPSGQVWLMRCGDELSVAVKGGTNGELHNHNDVGSYFLVSHGRLLSGDPGGEEYTARTFSARRYESKVINSYGHPVPVVGGRLQSTGVEFAAKVLGTEFTDARDTVSIDISGAYEAKSLKSLVRTFVFDRAEKSFTVTDRAEFSEPTSFEEAYTTFRGDEFGDVDVAVAVKAGGETVQSVEHIDNPGRMSPDRHSVRFASPVDTAEISFTFRARPGKAN